jgi:hypothetical protein
MAPSKKSVAPAKSASSMVKWDEEMARQAAIASAATGAATGTFVNLKNGILSVDKTPVPGNKLAAVVVAHCFENAYYVGKYDPNNPQPPVCFAYGVPKPGMPIDEVKELEDNMVPHDMSTDKQNSNCKTCPRNQWGSADEGKGKACKNLRRLALIPGDEESLVQIDKQKLYFMKPPVTSSKFFDGYVKDIAKTLKRPPMGVVTEISVVPDPKSQFLVKFELVEKIQDADQFEALAEISKRAFEEIDFPYQPASDEQKKAAPAAARNAGPRKFAAPAKGARR